MLLLLILLLLFLQKKVAASGLEDTKDEEDFTRDPEVLCS
jgi:hypothetical protein